MEESKMKAMGRKIIILVMILIVSLIFTSCNGIVAPEIPLNANEDIGKLEELEEKSYVYLNVPFEKYAGVNWCLPASGAMTFKYFGLNVNQNEIANSIIKNGTSSVFRFISYAQKLGFNTKYQSKTIEEIKALLEENIPVIAVQNYSQNILQSHARVIIGFDDENEEIITNDPTAGKDYTLSYSDFLALNFDSNPDKCKVIILSNVEYNINNFIAESNINNS